MPTINFIIFYCKVMDDKQLGVIVDYPFYGGEAETKEEAEQKAKEIVNVSQNQMTIIPKIFEKGKSTFVDIMEESKVRFEKMAEEMYECEAAIIRRKKRRN